MMEKQIYRLEPTYPVNQLTANFIMNPKPPSIYAILNSIANYDKEEYTKIRDLSEACHDKIFDFDYELSDKIDKEAFECDILNHYMMRRIGFDTVTAFQIYLENKLHEILPYYNVLFNALKDYSLFDSGEVVTRETVDDRNINNKATSDSETRFSDYPLDELDDLSSGKYVSNQTITKGNATNDTSDKNITNELIKRTPVDKMTLYKTYLETETKKIMSMIYKDLDILFYGLAD